MQYIEAPSKNISKYHIKVFLAGGITKVFDWQSLVSNELSEMEITLFNPRRHNFDVSKKEESRIQIEWEYNKLREATDIIFWFSHETIQPISLFELGSALERNQKLYIGVDPRYERKMDVEIQTFLSGKNIKIHSSLPELTNDFKAWNYKYIKD